ncbi:helix-hairpin-helix domain-containing protein [Prevotella sp. A2931]|uniref:Helix-hairpin-helix domain-containing protein n=1 Tax=Prevotella illustrans TaxID=2800387 RepID=A0ABS3M8D4_9BACT|nr:MULTISPECIES: helix-hairpin-helix domain-containing protein [Prevotella]MBO1364442.1 helix-hairpin-helix domain-containing protein [Prevotella illustrans]PTL27344.1 hypothetical protein C3V39_05625 [Prevotella sp. oral taxon 820]
MKWKDLTYLIKSDRIVLLTALLLGFLFILMVYLTTEGFDHSTAIVGDTVSVSSLRHNPRYPHRYYRVPVASARLFDFDPNTADSTQLLALGLRPWQVRNIYKYRAKGGIYRRPTDFACLYGLTRKDFLRLLPHIKISSDYLPAVTLAEPMPAFKQDTLKYPRKIQQLERVDLNKADTTQLRHVPGIGSYFARQIVNYRRHLGGFHSIQQLREIEDFPEKSLSYFILPDDDVTRINVNTATLSQLSRHPYITYTQARDIVDYRRLRGPIHSLGDLRLLKSFTPQALSRVEPYLKY